MKLWNLCSLRDREEVFPLTHYELIVFRPADSGPTYTDRQIEALLELEEEGDRHELRIVPVTSPEAAAERIIRQEQAA